MTKWPAYDPEVSGKIEDRTERRGVLGSHGFATVLGAFAGIAAAAAVGGALGGPIVAVVLAVIGAAVGAFAGRAAALAIRPTASDRVEHQHLSEVPVVRNK